MTILIILLIIKALTFYLYKKRAPAILDGRYSSSYILFLKVYKQFSVCCFPCLGSSGKVVRELTEKDLKMLKYSSDNYVEKGKEYREILK